MVSPEADPITSSSTPRVSFSDNEDDDDDDEFISISPRSHRVLDDPRNPDFEFLSSINGASPNHSMITADQLFFEGKLLPFWQVHHSQRLSKINLKPINSNKDDVKEEEEEVVVIAASASKNNNVVMIKNKIKNKSKEETSWYVDDDPSPRPPKCTVLWKELLRLKKQRNVSSLSPSPSSSSSSTSSSSASSSKEKQVKRVKKGLERSRSSSSVRIRPIINVPICTHSSLPPLFPLRKPRVSILDRS